MLKVSMKKQKLLVWPVRSNYFLILGRVIKSPINPKNWTKKSLTSYLRSEAFSAFSSHIWSGKRDSNSRPQPWQGYALPLSYSR